MKEPCWLTVQECLALHDFLLAEYGGAADLRDFGLLDSAIAPASQLFSYGKPTMADLAAAYAAGIVKNHPFVDGNKRTGFMMGVGFLERNGLGFFASEADAVIQTLALAAGAISEEDYASWLGSKSRAVK